MHHNQLIEMQAGNQEGEKKESWVSGPSTRSIVFSTGAGAPAGPFEAFPRESNAMSWTPSLSDGHHLDAVRTVAQRPTSRDIGQGGSSGLGRGISAGNIDFKEDEGRTLKIAATNLNVFRPDVRGVDKARLDGAADLDLLLPSAGWLGL